MIASITSSFINNSRISFSLAPAKEHTVGHNRSHVAVTFETCQHVLDKHQIGFLAGFWAPLAKAVGEFHVCAAVVLRKWGISQHAVELSNLTIL